VATGASKGIGASIAQHLAYEGAPVVVDFAIRKQGTDRVVAEFMGKGGRSISVPSPAVTASSKTCVMSGTPHRLPL
jgi:NAD(P)-dependent dehydrogenase (short-subunit alcohol dehydrogenase family)